MEMLLLTSGGPGILGREPPFIHVLHGRLRPDTFHEVWAFSTRDRPDRGLQTFRG